MNKHELRRLILDGQYVSVPTRVSSKSRLTFPDVLSVATGYEKTKPELPQFKPAPKTTKKPKGVPTKTVGFRPKEQKAGYYVFKGKKYKVYTQFNATYDVAEKLSKK